MIATPAPGPMPSSDRARGSAFVRRLEQAGPRPIELVVAYLICFGATIGPLAAFLLAR